MKENKMMRLASGLLVCVLLSSSVIGGTFAKYTSAGTLTDTARVAKWGVEISATSGAFKTTYDTDDTDAKKNGITSSVEAIVDTSVTPSKQDKVVAPGTDGVLLESAITGIPEVAVKVKAEATLTLENWDITLGEPSNTTSETYFPIIITVDGNKYKMGNSTQSTKTTIEGQAITVNEYVNIDELKQAVINALGGNMSRDFGPGVVLEDQKIGHTASWEWPIEDTTVGAYQTDEKDTALGNAAANATAEKPAPTIKLDYTITVTQID